MAIKAPVVISALAYAIVANAQVATWGQCGGVDYTGPTNCVSGSTCVEQNEFYSQCLPGNAPITTPLTPSSVPTAAPTNAKYFITFGDSYSQTDFDVTSTQPSAANPIGNPPFPGFTTTGGSNWIDFLVTQFNTSLMLSYNFAFGGATTDASLVAPFEPQVLSFIDQVSQFSESIASHPSFAPWTSANTLVGVWMGVNDVGNSFFNANSTETTLLGEIMDKYFAQLQILYNAGARNFALLNVPPIQRTPLMLADDVPTQQLEASVITEYNNLIASRLATFTKQNAGVVGKVVDTQAPFTQALNNPTAFGAANATCFDDDGVTCLWWNNYHPGMAIHKLVAQAVAAAFKGTFFT